MADKAVFLDRDNTIIEDPGYLSDPGAVKLIPGVELALKSLTQAGYKLIVVTNQSGIARGLLTEEQLERIHGELRRQLAEAGAHLDALFYCPYHPEGTVVEYAKDSELRKPRPGMLLKAAGQLDIDLTTSWMVGDSPRDIEAGQRAGCRTIRVRVPGAVHHAPAEESDEDVQADLTVRNLVEAAKAILRYDTAPPGSTPAPPTRVSSVATPSSSSIPAAGAAEPAPAAEPTAAEPDDSPAPGEKIQQEILTCLQKLVAEEPDVPEEFSFSKLASGLVQMLAALAVVIAVFTLLGDTAVAAVWALIGVALQLGALTLFFMRREK